MDSQVAAPSCQRIVYCLVVDLCAIWDACVHGEVKYWSSWTFRFEHELLCAHIGVEVKPFVAGTAAVVDFLWGDEAS